MNYSFSVLNQNGGEHFAWSDPEEILSFDAKDSGDDEWGCDEFISLDELYEGSPYTLGGKMIFSINMEVFGKDHLIESADTGDIEKVSTEASLEQLADRELVDVITRLPKQRDLNLLQNPKEDKLLIQHRPPVIRKDKSKQSIYHYNL